MTPSLEAAILNGKYVNTIPLYRMEQEFKRNSTHPEEFLKGYEGTFVTAGYAVYHAMEKKVSEIKVAYDALRQIAAIFKLEKELNKLSPEKRLNERQLTIRL